jgi:arylsulfatase A-like enzyme
LQQPNVLIIHTDQQNTWTLGAYGGRLLETPHIDSIGHQGVRFDNFFTNSAVCTPSRGCLLTGRYPHAHGAYCNNTPLNRDEITLAHKLSEQGYHTAYIGKWHLDGHLRPGWVHPDRSMGFADCRFMFNRGHWKKIEDLRMHDAQPVVHPYGVVGDEETFATDWLVTKAIEFIRETPGPFCCMLSIPDPHPPFTVRPPYDTMYHPEGMPVPGTFSQYDLPAWARTAREKGPYRMDRKDREEVLRHNMALYCGMVKCIDDNVGRILDSLRSTGTLDCTIVVFSTDHGEYLGEHGLNGKNQLYETVYRLPLLMRWPAAIAPGTVVSDLVAMVDVYPTLLGLLGLEANPAVQGRDASPLVRGERIPWENEVFIHHSSLGRAGIFTSEYGLGLVKGGEHVLFDRARDPEQAHNLYHTPAYRAVVDELVQRVVSHHGETHSPAAGWLASIEGESR